MRSRLFALVILFSTSPALAEDAQLQQGDHVTIIGNLLAERMQHDGWLETLVQQRRPEYELSFRNLGFSGDELAERSRSASFGSPDDWLTRCEADVVWAFFGYNESFDGEAGLEQFRQQLVDFIRATRSKTYNGESPARLVLFSPIAFENLGNPNLPDGTEHNRRLELYTAAMAAVAGDEGVPFVDLFHPTLEEYAASDSPLTLNGHYLNEAGNRFVATVIDRVLFGEDGAADLDSSRTARIREAVQDKNFYWFHRYRTTDGYNVYGGRSQKRYTDNISNFEVLQREMEVLDAMTANRDRAVWAAVREEPYIVDDSNTPEFIPVRTNLPGPHEFLGGEEAIERMATGEGMRVNLFASDEQFPELINPVQMAFDTQGRLFVAVWPSYPHWKPKDPMNDKLLIFKDTDGDGRADEVKTFADGLNNPTGFEFWGGGVLVAMAPDLLFLQDTDGDDVADVRTHVLQGIDTADTHHTANSFLIGPDGALYFQEGTFHMSQIESVEGVERNTNGCVWRFDPRTWDVDRYVAFNFANPHGHVFTRWGQDIVHDGTGAVPYHATLFSGHVDFPDKHRQPPVLYDRRTRPCPGTEILSSRHFPEKMQQNLLVANVIGVQGILQYEIDEQDSSFAGTEVEPIVTSSDPNFRPTDMEVAPDGSLYFVDWQNPIIGHLQHHIRDPNRDKTHGRIYRVTYPSRPLLTPPRIAGAPIADLLELLKSPEDRVRYRTRIELSGRDSGEVIAAARNWIANLDPNDENYEHNRLEGLWLHQQHNVVNEELLRDVLQSPDHRARAAATRVLCYWRDRIPNSINLLRQLAADPHSHVRLQAVRAASFYRIPEAVEVPVITSEFPDDKYISFLREETMRTLEPYWTDALASGQKIEVTSDAGMRFLLRRISTEDLLQMPRDRAVYLEMLYREGLRDEQRREALVGLAHEENRSQLRVLLDAINNLDAQQKQSVAIDLVRLLTSFDASELAAVRPDLETMATDATLGLVRQVGYVALAAADESVDPAWDLAAGDVFRLRDLVQAMPLIVDPGVRASLYPRVSALLDGLPPGLVDPDRTGNLGTPGRYVRIELPGRRRILTLAEVEVYAEGTNVARGGKATQINVDFGGVPQRAIDGNTNSSYGSGTQTHTRQSDNPWWELDLGREELIESIKVYNRTEGDLGNRLDNFTLTILDSERRPVFTGTDNPAPTPSITLEVGGGGPEAVIRRAAMNAITYVRGQELDAFTRLAGFVEQGVDRNTAIHALQRIPRRFWPQDQAEPLAASIIEFVSAIPTEERTAPSVVNALQLGDALASLLPPERGRAVRAELGDLGVRVIRIGTLPHRMAYDVERIVVQAGKPVQFVFDNTDLMPHNFCIAKPGSLEAVGTLAEQTAQEPGALERHYVPQTDQILLSSELLSTGQSQQLNFPVPGETGVYPYVCTYPGHWRRMFGALYVVASLDEYYIDPEAYLANYPLEIHDELLKFNRPRTEWTYDDLAPSIEEMSEGRDFAHARRIFEVANCVACHRLNDVGIVMGPDLSKLDEKLQAPEILRELLEPSKRINEKYYSYTFLLESGNVVSGLVVEETDDVVKVVENPLARSEPRILKVDEIEERQKSDVSIMPQGLLDKLTRDEILDLIAYITARGREDHPLFHGAGHHGH